MTHIKTLVLDIECSPTLATVWGLWNQNIGINQLIGDSEVLCWSASWEGKKEVYFTAKNMSGRRRMIKAIHKLMAEADEVVTYNGDSYDLKVLNKEFALFGLAPPAPYKSVDLLKVVKKKFRLTSNKLDYVLRYFKLGAKKSNRGHELWLDVMANKPEAWKEMKEYNITDVTELKKLLHFLRSNGWMAGVGINRARKPAHCSTCGSDHVHFRGWHYTKKMKYRRFQCQKCGSWDHLPKGERIEQ